MARDGMTRGLRLAVLLLAQLLFSGIMACADVQTLHAFNNSDGAAPNSSLVQDTDGNLYGTTNTGGDFGYGCIYLIDPQGDEYILYSFSGPDGASPTGNLAVDGSGNIYGTTATGGAFNGGTVFKLDTADNLTTLHSFAGNTDGSNPSGVIRDSSGNLYGAAASDGQFGDGTLYKLTSKGVFTTLVHFNGNNGLFPYCTLVRDSAGNLYGTTYYGGAHDAGTLFKLSPTNVLTTLHSFSNGADGGYPFGGVCRDSSGDFYGTAISGGSASYGVVYKFTAAGAFSVLYNFTGGLDGGFPYNPPIRDNAGNLYGATNTGGLAQAGTVYRLNPTTGVLNLLHHFKTSDFFGAYAGLLRDKTGAIYGAAGYTTGGYGAVFKITYPYTVSLHTFNYSDGNDPFASMISDSAGNLYGTCSSGGAFGDGTIFKLSPNGALTTLYNFSGGDGNEPTCVLLRDGSGNLYGTTRIGGAFNYGTIFKLSPTGGMTILHSFVNSDGSGPQGGVIRDGSGNLYGTTTFGGANNNGTIFKLSPNGTLTTLFSFNYTPTGGFPGSSLLRDSLGNLYGTCSSGGPYGHGVVFKLDTNNQLTLMRSFTGKADGDYPYGALIRDNVGNFYGTTAAGGNGGGTIYKLDAHNRLFVLHSFAASLDGGYSFAELTRDGSGNLYGVNDLFGVFNAGNVFKLSTTNVLTTLSNFSNVDSNGKNAFGVNPFGGLVRDGKGNLYGVCSSGGLFGYGSVFAILN